MQKPRVSMIVAVTRNGVIGNKGDLVVRISDDLKERFRKLTMGHPVVMGRKTFESIGKPLIGRTNYVVTRSSDLKAAGAIVCLSLEDALVQASKEESASANGEKEVFIVGGGEIYVQGMPSADRLYITLVDTEAEGDTRFPDYSHFKKVLKREDRLDQKTGLKYSWIDLEK